MQSVTVGHDSGSRRQSEKGFRALRAARLLSVSAAALCPTIAYADCTPPTGTTVTCTGASTGYSNVTTGVNLTADSTAAITGPVILGDTVTVNNSGSITSSTAAPILQVGSSSSVTNNGTIQFSGTTNGSAAVVLGDNSTFTNNKSLSATTGYLVLQFGQGGTFNNTSAATTAVTGNISFGANISGGTSTLNNSNTAFGITGNISSIGNTVINNSGLITGSFVQTPTGGQVNFLNDTAGNFTGTISTGDVTSLLNNGSLTVSAASVLGGSRLGTSSLINNGTLNVGSGGVAQLVVVGSFVNSPGGTLNIALNSSGTTGPVAGSTYSQVYAAGPDGTATLGGTLNIVPTAGFYQTGSTYNLILADQSISGSFASVNGSTLPFIHFIPVGIVTVGSQQSYQVMAIRPTTYADAIASVATPSQLLIAQSLNPLVTAANTDPTSTAAVLVGQIDLLTIPQTQTLLDQINPAGYVAFGQTMLDQMNMLNRQVALRSADEVSDEYHAGWWVDGSGQFGLGKTPTIGAKEKLFGVTGGYDISRKALRLGVVAGFSSGSLKALTGPGGTNNAYMLGLYGRIHAGPAFALGQVDYELGSFSAKKNLALSYTTAAATSTTAATASPNYTLVDASSHEHLLKLSGIVGFNLPVGILKITPFGGIDYAKGSISGFTEVGAVAADLTVARLPVDRTDALAGLNVTSSSGFMRPYVRAVYRSRIGSGSNSLVSAYFDGDPTTSFTLAGTGMARQEADVDAGVNWVYDEGALFFGYQGTIRKGMSDHGLHGGIRLMF
jgi:uncharacterized protein YhjY with autotransporter beta-barrel domain